MLVWPILRYITFTETPMIFIIIVDSITNFSQSIIFFITFRVIAVIVYFTKFEKLFTM